MTKKISSFLLTLGLLLPVAASASVDLTSTTLTPDPAETGQSVSVSIEAQKTGAGCDNNWGYTKVFVDGVQVGTTTLDSFTGSGTTTDSFNLGSFATAGDRVIDVELWSGAEDFSPADGNPDCADTLLDSDSVTLDVDAPAPSNSGGSQSSGSTSGGGGYTYCDLDTQPTSQLRDIAMCLDRTTGKVVNALAWRMDGDSAGIRAFKIELMWKAVGLLNQMIDLVKAGVK